MRQTISGLVAAIALTAASAAPAMACGYGGCAPYAPAYTTNTGCYTCGGWEYERLTDPETQYHVAEPTPQYYYVNQGPTYTGPGAFAPYPTYQEGAVSYSHRGRPYFRSWRGRTGYHYSVRPSARHERKMQEPMIRRYN